MQTKNLLNLLIVAMTLGTAWAVRGKFGHEQGAAWAGAIGALSILLIAKRSDWYAKAFKATLAAAIGWGLGGMMSYGILVGYGNGSDFINVYYSFFSLFVVGGLYGYIGGGLFGLALEEREDKKVNWALLIAGMTSSGALAYFSLIMQWEWLMTPPRSELWAACFGGAIFLAWFMKNQGFHSAYKVALWSGLGGGFGFAFGNFLKVMGLAANLPRSLWNVMEYSLGFFGGLGMAYGTFTSSWDTTREITSKRSNLGAILILVLFIPFVVWSQTFSIKKISDRYGFLADGNLNQLAFAIQISVLLLILGHALFVWNRYFRSRPSEFNYSWSGLRLFFITHFGLYILLSFIITAAMFDFTLIEQYLYLVNLGVILYFLPSLQAKFEARDDYPWGRYAILLILFFAILTLIAINSHDVVEGVHRRFEF